jgi:hypothetical protein
VNIPKCDRCIQAYETATLVLCDREALATLRFRHLGQLLMKPGDLEDICVRRILLTHDYKGCIKDQLLSKCMVPDLFVFFSVLPQC